MTYLTILKSKRSFFVLIKASKRVGTPNKTLGLYFSNNLSNFLALNCGINMTSHPNTKGALIDTPKPNP